MLLKVNIPTQTSKPLEGAVIAIDTKCTTGLMNNNVLINTKRVVYSRILVCVLWSHNEDLPLVQVIVVH